MCGGGVTRIIHPPRFRAGEREGGFSRGSMEEKKIGRRPPKKQRSEGIFVPSTETGGSPEETSRKR